MTDKRWYSKSNQKAIAEEDSADEEIAEEDDGGVETFPEFQADKVKFSQNIEADTSVDMLLCRMMLLTEPAVTVDLETTMKKKRRRRSMRRKTTTASQTSSQTRNPTTTESPLMSWTLRRECPTRSSPSRGSSQFNVRFHAMLCQCRF